MTHAALKDLLEEYDRVRDSLKSCSDGGCVVKRPVGMHTNGGCRCSTDKHTARTMMWAGQKLRDSLSAALSAMEGEAVCPHESWERLDCGPDYETRECSDCGDYLGRFKREHTAPPPQQAEHVHEWIIDPDLGAGSGYLYCRVCKVTRKHDSLADTHPTPSPGPQGGGECKTCGGYGLVGGWRHGEGWDSHPCPDCATPPAHQPGEVAKPRIVGVDYGSSDQTSYAINCPCGRLHDITAAIAALAPKEDGHG